MLDDLCLGYITSAFDDLDSDNVPKWHHKLLHAWCGKQRTPSRTVTADDLSAHDEMWPEMQLAVACGPRLADALSGRVAYTELLFPGGSMDAVLPVYESAVVGSFYNAAIVAAMSAILTNQGKWQPACSRLVRGRARQLRASYPCLTTTAAGVTLSRMYRRSSFGKHAHDLPNMDSSSTYCSTSMRTRGYRASALRSSKHYCLPNVHARLPSIRATRWCHRSSPPTLTDNAPVETDRCAGHVRLTGTTANAREQAIRERVGQDSPLLSWKQWESLLADCDRAQPVHTGRRLPYTPGAHCRPGGYGRRGNGCGRGAFPPRKAFSSSLEERAV